MTAVNSADPFGLVGQVLDGQFRVDRLVGEGGFSVVYKGHHQGLNEPIAVKCLKLPSALGTSLVDSFVQRFRDESRILYRLSQGNLHIVRSVAAGTTQAPITGALVPYMVLEWLEGRSLQNDLTVRRTLGNTGRSLEEVVTLFGPAADALGYAHAQGVVHRDLNPGNIFLAATARGTLTKVLDFGVAKIMHDSTLNIGPRAPTVGQIRIFAPAYGAPEQFDDRIGIVAAPSDVYSFALILLEALRDKPVNDAPHIGAFAHLAVDPARRPTPRALGIAVPDEVEAAFARATSLDPRARWQSVSDFWQSLTIGMKVATELRYEKAARETPSLELRAQAPQSLQQTIPLGVKDAPSIAGSSQVTAPPAKAFPLAPDTMSAAPREGGSSPRVAGAVVSKQGDPRRTMMLAGGPPRMGAAPAPPSDVASSSDVEAPKDATDPSSFVPEPTVEPMARTLTDAEFHAAQARDALVARIDGGGEAEPAPPSMPKSREANAPNDRRTGLGGTLMMAAAPGAPPGAQSAVFRPTPPSMPAPVPTDPRTSQLPDPRVSQVHDPRVSHLHGGPPSYEAALPSFTPAPPQGYGSQVYAPAPSQPQPLDPSWNRGSAVPPQVAPSTSAPATSSPKSRAPLVAIGVVAAVVVLAGASFAGYRYFQADRRVPTDPTLVPSASVTAPEVPTASAPPPVTAQPTSEPPPATSTTAAPPEVPEDTKEPVVPPAASSAPVRPSTVPPSTSASEPGHSTAPAVASSTTPKTSPSASASSTTDPNAFDEAGARQRLSAANSVLVICKHGGASGPGKASVTFGPDGTVTAVSLAPPYEGTKEGTCAVNQFRRVKIRPFTGAPHTLQHTFEIPK